jgi:peptidoglycan/xylan/chitin deacetylase (PgdA/CDA1 family)
MIHSRAGTSRAKPAWLPVLTYHAFGTRRSVTTTDPSWFVDTIGALVESGFAAVDLADWVAKGRPDSPQAFALAFDDGLRSVLRVADIVTAYRVPATVFTVAGRVGLDNAWLAQRRDVPIERLLSWDELGGLIERGFQVASHGMSHARLDRCASAVIDDELKRSKQIIEQKLGRPCPLLAYPGGFSSAAVRLCAAQHYHAAFGTRLDYAGDGQDPYDLARIDAYYLRSGRSLRKLVSGDLRGWLGLRRTLRAFRKVLVPRQNAGYTGATGCLQPVPERPATSRVPKTEPVAPLARSVRSRWLPGGPGHRRPGSKLGATRRAG